MVNAFFCGFSLPRFITHTNLVLIPKKEKVKQIGDLRPISLSNFVNKIFSRLLLERLSKIIPHIISPNKTGFVKERKIVENVLPAQEIIRDHNKRTKKYNVMVKLDIS